MTTYSTCVWKYIQWMVHIGKVNLCRTYIYMYALLIFLMLNIHIKINLCMCITIFTWIFSKIYFWSRSIMYYQHINMFMFIIKSLNLIFYVFHSFTDPSTCNCPCCVITCSHVLPQPVCFSLSSSLSQMYTHTHAHARTHARMHARTQAHTHAHTHTCVHMHPHTPYPYTLGVGGRRSAYSCRTGN